MEGGRDAERYRERDRSRSRGRSRDRSRDQRRGPRSHDSDTTSARAADRRDVRAILADERAAGGGEEGGGAAFIEFNKKMMNIEISKQIMRDGVRALCTLIETRVGEFNPVT